MSRFELLSILIAVVGVGAVLAGLIVNGQSTIRAEARADRAEAQAAREAMQVEAQAAREAMRAEARADRAEARAAREATRTEARADRTQFQAEIKRLLERQGKVEGLVEGLTRVTPSG